jgi:tetratricopeptide (TPR) repeat protein
MLRARELLEKAVAAEPDFPLSHLALGESWIALGFGQKAREEATEALHLSTHLSWQDQLFVRAFYFETNADWQKAAQSYQTLFNSFPDNLEYGLRLARAQSTAGKGKDALLTVEALRQLPLPSGEDPRIDLAEALAAKSLGDFKHERAAAASAGTKATSQGARLGVAEAKLEEGGALDDLGQPKAAVELEGEAKTIFSAAGDQGGVARALNDIGTATLHEGNLVAAERMFADSSDLARKIGNKRLLTQSLNNIAIVRYQQGNLAEAAMISQQAADNFREIGDKNALATSLNNVAAIRTDLGDLQIAKQKYTESLAITHETGDSNSLARTLSNLARLLLREGDLRGAEGRYQEALKAVSIGREYTYAAQGLGDVSFWRGDLTGAERQYGEALQLRSQIGDHELMAESRMMIAQVLVEKGNFRKAQEYAQDAIDEFRKAGNGDEEAEAEAILALAFTGQAMPSKAQDTIKQATSLAAKSEDHDVHLSVGIDSALLSADTGDIQAAVIQLQVAISEAKKCHYRGYELEARLRLAEIELRGRDSSKGRTHLGVLAKEATAEGFGLIADAANKDLKERAHAGN